MVNDPAINPDCLAYAVKHDSFYGKSSIDIVEMGCSLMLNGVRVEITQEPNIEKIPWAKNKVDYIIDTTGQNSNCQNASKFLVGGVKRVIVTGCSSVPIFIFGVNQTCYELDMKVVSAGTPCMNALLPLLKILHEHFSIEQAMSRVIRPVTNSDNILDGTTGLSCRGTRSILNTFTPIVPFTTPDFVNRIIPELEGKNASTAIRVCAPIVGAVSLTVRLRKEATYDIIKCRLKEASESYMKGIVGFTEESATSSDMIGNTNSCIVDAKSGISIDKRISNVYAWYDSELGFASRIFDLASYMASREGCPSDSRV
ncbi:unnamed protein product [Acanthoscelides obtectus]|nr:unnamed protein product [Acanthoscelides obtectus]CAK1661987.1 Glyceraldehyde-3-phosphate dehydrogenase [Acanthoscelides obtectus]